VFLERIPVDSWKPATYSLYPPKWWIMSEIGTENGKNRGRKPLKIVKNAFTP